MFNADVVSWSCSITEARSHYTNIYELIIPIFFKYMLAIHGEMIKQSRHSFTISMTALQRCHGMCKILSDCVIVIKISAKCIGEIRIMSS